MSRKYRFSNDAQLKSDLLGNNEKAMQYVFFDHFKPLLRHNACKIVGYDNMHYFDDLVQELYLYISADNWAKLQMYDPKVEFVRWLSVVSYRFFKDKAPSMIPEKNEDSMDKMIDSGNTLPLYKIGTVENSDIMTDLLSALEKYDNERDKQILNDIYVIGFKNEEIAERYGITVDNLYNIKRRATAKLIKFYLTGYEK